MKENSEGEANTSQKTTSQPNAHNVATKFANESDQDENEGGIFLDSYEYFHFATIYPFDTLIDRFFFSLLFCDVNVV